LTNKAESGKKGGVTGTAEEVVEEGEGPQRRRVKRRRSFWKRRRFWIVLLFFVFALLLVLWLISTIGHPRGDLD
jgi:hypothetical protein